MLKTYLKPDLELFEREKSSPKNYFLLNPRLKAQMLGNVRYSRHDLNSRHVMSALEHHLKNGTFDGLTNIHELNTRQVCYSKPH